MNNNAVLYQPVLLTRTGPARTRTRTRTKPSGQGQGPDPQGQGQGLDLQGQGQGQGLQLPRRTRTYKDLSNRITRWHKNTIIKTIQIYHITDIST